MASYLTMTIFVLVAIFSSSQAGVLSSVVAPAPLVAAAPVAPVFGYEKAVPQNIPPHASRIDIGTRALASPYIAAAPYIAAPAAIAPPARLAYAPAAAPHFVGSAAASYVAGPVAAPYIAGHIAAPYIAGNVAAPYIAAPGASLAYSGYESPVGLVDARGTAFVG